MRIGSGVSYWGYAGLFLVAGNLHSLLALFDNELFRNLLKDLYQCLEVERYGTTQGCGMLLFNGSVIPAMLRLRTELNC
jgi:hypothetical protein